MRPESWELIADLRERRHITATDEAAVLDVQRLVDHAVKLAYNRGHAAGVRLAIEKRQYRKCQPNE